MAADEITFTNPNVNSGNAVTVAGGSITYQWKNLTKVQPAEALYDISESHYGGFENPHMTIQGILDADFSKSEDDTRTWMSHKLLVDFASCKAGTTALKISLGSTPLVIGGRPSGGYSTSGANTLDTTNGIDIQIDSFTLNSSVESAEYGSRIDFTIDCHETR